MTRYLSLIEVLDLHHKVLERWGGGGGLRDRPALESALAQPRQSFGNQELYPDLSSKAAALCHSLALNLFLPRETGHRVKNPIMIRNEVLNEKTTQASQSGIQARSGGIGGGAWL